MPSGPIDVGYARSGDVSIAYRVIGEGDRDLLFVHGLAGNLEAEAEEPNYVKFDERISRFSRLIKFDRRGTGLSDRVRETPSLETRMDDVRAVLDAVGAPRAALFGTFEAAAICMLFAASYPERTSGLVLYNPIAKGSWAPDYPWAMTLDESRRRLAYFGEWWGTPEFVDRLVREMAPTRGEDDAFKGRVLRNLRLGASPSAAQAIARMRWKSTSVMCYRPSASRLSSSRCRRFAMRLDSWPTGSRGARFRGSRAQIFLSPCWATKPTTKSKASFAASTPRRSPKRCSRPSCSPTSPTRPERSPSSATAPGRNSCPGTTRSCGGIWTRSAGPRSTPPGTVSSTSFEGPLRAIRCARAISESVRSLGVEVRAGLHTGECERVEGKIGGLAVNIGARVAAAASPGEILVSSTVKDLVAGSAVVFEDCGTHELKGVPGEWRLYAVTSA